MSPWSWFLSTWVIHFGQSSESFWRSTPYEFWSLFNVKFEKQIAERPMDRDTLRELMEKFPDGNNARRTNSKT